MKKLKSSKGITLIALVITIIILLILAGISIAMLTGENGILTKVTDAKENTGRAEVIESAKTDILGQIAENEGNNISKQQFKNILSKYFEDADSLELPDNLSESNQTVTANQKYGGYTNIALTDIYDGILKEDEISSEVITAKNYGDKVNYSVTINDIELDNWKLFYNESGMAYIIYGSYLPNSTNLASNAGLSITSDYGVYSETDRDKFIEVLKTASNWEKILTDKLKKVGATAKGTVDIETFIKSSNATEYI